MAPSVDRPLGMLDTTGKLYERMILNRIGEILDALGSEGLSDMQFGFRAGRSTLHAVQEVQKKVTEAFNSKHRSGGFCAVITLDVKNAFNSVSWENIFLALRKRIPEYLLRVASSYLEDRVVLAETDEGTIEVNISAGVAQGSVKGPTMWNIMYDDLLRLKLPKGVTLVGYADDVAAVVTGDTTEEIEVKTNETLAMVSDWMKDHWLKLAQEKSEAVLITKRRSFKLPELELDNYPIQFKGSIRYLGIWIDKKWDFKDHIKQAATKAGSVGTCLQRLMPNVGGPKPERRKLLTSVIHSILLYGAPIWASRERRPAVVKHMGPVQRRMALRVISGFRTISYGAAFLISGIQPIWLMAEERRRIWVTQELYFPLG